ncbi:MAG: HAD-IC family P-type ATPase, partial [Gammaproteobacteria bacterium]|nr:HAD-IC family P-type ATPase [Gammaproteobacteria bacterium]
MNKRHIPGENTAGPVPAPYALPTETVLDLLNSSLHGLTHDEAAVRLGKYGRNTLPKAKLPGVSIVFLSQFKSPLIYVLLAAAVLSLAIQEWSDAGFISAVLIINAVIGTIQESSAQRAAAALQALVNTKCKVLREGETYEINADELVPGDIVILEPGDRVPADMRLFMSHDLAVDESLLTGESLPVQKECNTILTEDIVLGDRVNMLYTGTMVNRGRARGIVVNTALDTVLGSIAADVLFQQPSKAPLQVRMDRFTHRVAIFVGIAALIMFAVSVSRGTAVTDVFLLAVALAVSVIPEGLPVALTVALAIGMRRMAKRNVIVRRLLAVESLGSCTLIATDKTGTLTVNKLTARKIIFPNNDSWEITGEGVDPAGAILPHESATTDSTVLLERLCRIAVLTNEGFLGRTESGWSSHGDAVDVAFLVMAHKAGIVKADVVNVFPEIDTIPYESELQFSASLNKVDKVRHAFVKGALERLLPMCSTMAMPGSDVPIDAAVIEQQTHMLARHGYRVIALACGKIEIEPVEDFNDSHLHGLTLVGLVGIIDPLRTEAKLA